MPRAARLPTWKISLRWKGSQPEGTEYLCFNKRTSRRMVELDEIAHINGARNYRTCRFYRVPADCATFRWDGSDDQAWGASNG